MDTAAAALTARHRYPVSIGTIRTWCRRRVIAARKVAGRWLIEETSLLRRIEIGARMETPLALTSSTRTPGAPVAVLGPAERLAAAFESGTPVTITRGKFSGEVVYLGHTRQVAGDDGITLDTVGPDRPAWTHEGVEMGAYLVDVTRLEQAPGLAALHARAQGILAERAAHVEERIAAEDERLDRLAEDGA